MTVADTCIKDLLCLSSASAFTAELVNMNNTLWLWSRVATITFNCYWLVSTTLLHIYRCYILAWWRIEEQNLKCSCGHTKEKLTRKTTTIIIDTPVRIRTALPINFNAEKKHIGRIKLSLGNSSPYEAYVLTETGHLFKNTFVCLLTVSCLCFTEYIYAILGTPLAHI